MDKVFLEEKGREIRKEILSMLYKSKSGHPGGSLSLADVFSVLYFHQLNVDPNNPQKEDRDRLVLSKGHGAPVLYATLAIKGYFPMEELNSLRKIDSMLQGHPDMKGTPGVDMSTGSLGQGFSASVGMALGCRLKKIPNRIYAILGDGELQEGLVWEAAMAASHYKLDNLTAILDYNRLQIDGNNDDVISVKPVDQKFRTFGWNVIEINGHDYGEIIDALISAENFKLKPTLILCNTIKGKGVSFMEDQAGWHGKAPNEDEYIKAINELGGVLDV